MNKLSPHRRFAVFTLGAFTVTAGAAVGFTALVREPSADLSQRLEGTAPDKALQHLRRYLSQRRKLEVIVTDGRPSIAWNNGFRLDRHGLLDHFRFHMFTFAARAKEGAAPDIFRARARVNRHGVPIEVSDLVNLTRTAHGHEQGLRVHGPFVAYLNRIDGLLRQVVLLDYRGEPAPSMAKMGTVQRVMNAITNWQEYRNRRGVGRATLEFVRAPAKAALRFVDSGTLEVTCGPGCGGRLDLSSGKLDSAAKGLTSIPTPPKARVMFVDWVANTIRRFIGEKRFEWVKVFALALKDRWKRLRNALFGPGAPDSDEIERGRVVKAHAKVKNLQVKFGQDPNWPPPAVEPILETPKLPGEGLWVDVYDFDLRNPSAPPALLKTIVRPDPKRPHAAVRLVLIDPRQVDLHIVAGIKHPRSTTGHHGSGLIPRDQETMSRLLAAFNGGFKTMHGAFGMMVEGKVIVPPQKGAATVARLKDGRVALGTWNIPKATPIREIAAYRQNLPPLIEKGVINPTGLRKWGNTVSHMDGTHTYRSALGVTKYGHLIYAWGDDLSAQTMAQAMVQAQCVYAVHLDMNYGHSRFEFYRVYDDRSIVRAHPKRKIYKVGKVRFQARKLSRAQISWLFPRYIHRDTRDFFYLTLRRVFPYEDPAAPGWSVDGLPEGFRAFPPLIVRAKLTVDQGEVQVFKLDSRRSRFRLRLGGTEADIVPQSQREIARSELPQLAAVFGIGTPDEGLGPPGTRIAGRRVSMPRPGRMSLVLDEEGRARVERWNPKLGGAHSLRQGLALIEGGKLSDEAKAAAPSRARLRGAFGVDRRGDLLYAVARTTTPLGLAGALVRAGAIRAVALGPGRKDASFRLFTPGDKAGVMVATNVATGEAKRLNALPLSYPQTFLYLVPAVPDPRVVSLANALSGTRRGPKSARK